MSSFFCSGGSLPCFLYCKGDIPVILLKNLPKSDWDGKSISLLISLILLSPNESLATMLSAILIFWFKTIYY